MSGNDKPKIYVPDPAGTDEPRSWSYARPSLKIYSPMEALQPNGRPVEKFAPFNPGEMVKLRDDAVAVITALGAPCSGENKYEQLREKIARELLTDSTPMEQSAKLLSHFIIESLGAGKIKPAMNVEEMYARLSADIDLLSCLPEKRVEFFARMGVARAQ